MNRVTLASHRSGSVAVESLISIVLMAMLSVLVSQFVGSISRISRMQQMRSQAVQLASNSIEQLMASQHDQLEDLAKQIGSQQHAIAGSNFGVTVTIDSREVQQLPGRQITVRVTRLGARESEPLFELSAWKPARPEEQSSAS